MIPVAVQKVSLSDCGRALDAIDAELRRLTSQKHEVERKMSALRTQAMMLVQIARRTQ